MGKKTFNPINPINSINSINPINPTVKYLFLKSFH